MSPALFCYSSTVRTSVAALYDFHLDPRNARLIMPPGLRLAELELPPKHEVGAEIALQLRVFGLGPLRWRVRWAELVPPMVSPATGRTIAKLSDETLKGPFPLFYHEHSFEELGPNQARLRDRITFRPPFGAAGWLLLPAIYLQLGLTFAYRHARTRQILESGEIEIGQSKGIT